MSTRDATLPAPTTTLVVKSQDVDKFELQQRMANLFARSGLFADIRGASIEQAIAQAFVKIALGETMGFSAVESMTGIDIIKGRVAVGANLRASRMQQAGYSWDFLQLDDEGCRLKLKYKGEPMMTTIMDPETGEELAAPVIVSYTAQDAERAQLLGKDNYQHDPTSMFFARAITRAQRWYAPAVLAVDVPSIEEVGSGDYRGGFQKAQARLEEIKQRFVKPEDEVQEMPAHEDESQEPVAVDSAVEAAQQKLAGKRAGVAQRDMVPLASPPLDFTK